jgi:hypothetical protein
MYTAQAYVPTHTYSFNFFIYTYIDGYISVSIHIHPYRCDTVEGLLEGLSVHHTLHIQRLKRLTMRS